MSSRTHQTWALAAGGRLGVGNDSRYNNTRCFETFPFPALASPNLAENEQPDAALVAKLAALGEQLDAHRKRQQVEHAGLTLTGMYNVLEKLKAGAALNDKEKTIHEQGLVSVLKSLHDEIDLCVLEAYGWGDLAGLMQVVNGNSSAIDCPSPPPSPRTATGLRSKTGGGARELFAASNGSLAPPPSLLDQNRSERGEGWGEGQANANSEQAAGYDPPENISTAMTRTEAIRQLDEALLERLVALNAVRAAEEKRGLIRYLRPDFQDPNFKAKVPEQVELAIQDDEQSDDEPTAVKAVKSTKTAWPKTLPDQVRALLDLLKTQNLPAAQIAQNFSGIKAPKLGELLQTLVDMGRLRETKEGFSL